MQKGTGRMVRADALKVAGLPRPANPFLAP